MPSYPLDGSVLGHAGQYRDPVAMGYPLGNGQRVYVPGLMRFTKPDNLSPFGAGGVNPYVYCLDDPIDCSDPNGHFVIEAIVGSTFGITAASMLGAAMAPAILEARAIASVIPESPAGRLGTVLADAMIRAPKRAAAAVAGLGSAALATATGVASYGLSDVAPEMASALAKVSLASGGLALGAVISPILGILKNASRMAYAPAMLERSLRAHVDVTSELRPYLPSYLRVELGEADTLLPPFYPDNFAHRGAPPPYDEYEYDHRPPVNSLPRRRAFSDPRSLTSTLRVPPSRIRSYSKNEIEHRAQRNPLVLRSEQNPWRGRLADTSPDLEGGA